MTFCIQVSNPRLIAGDINIENDYSLGDVLESIYDWNSEKVIITWNNIYIPLSYKYDISIMVDDIVYMLKSVLSSEEGDIKFDWPSNTFDVNWQIHWDKELLRIESHWNEVLGGLTELLNKKNNVQLKKSDFLNEWKMLLQKLNTHLKEAQLENSKYVRELEGLIKQIKGYGLLYNY